MKNIFAHLPSPAFTRLRNKKIFDWMNTNAPNKKVLNLGAGVGYFDSLLSTDIKMVNLDINFIPGRVDIIADAQKLPFPDESFDIVYSIAVLEHIKKPWLAADEITRVLLPGGYVVLELPLHNVIHDENDYFRFTDKGIRSLFDETKYDIVLQQVSAGGGSFLSVFLLTYLRQFVPTKIGKTIWYRLMSYPLSLLKYFDCLVNNSKELRLTANSFSFIGRKR